MDGSRRPDIDWLRVGATYLLFVFHSGMVFSPAPFYHVRNADVSFAMLIVCGFISIWHMPLFFLLAGWSAAASLRVRGTRDFAAERVRRLAIPLVAGCVLLAPGFKYVELRSGLDLSHEGLRVTAELQPTFASVIPGGLPLAEPYEESFASFLPTFFTDLDRFSWGHLWFVAYLFTLSMAYLPLLAWLRRRPGRLQDARPWIVYLPLVPLILIQLLLRPRWPGLYNLYDDWANVAYYSVFLLSGFLLACHPALERLVAREWKRALALALAAMGVSLLAVLGVIGSQWLLLVVAAVAGWCFVIALLGLGQRLRGHSSRMLSYLSESAFPVYVLHQSAIVIPGYFIVQLEAGIAAKFMLLVAVSLALTLATYHWLVRPFALPRFLLGMRPGGGRSLPMAPARAATVVLAASLLAAEPALAVASPIGLWYAERGAARVRIETCGEALCGRVVWLRSPFDEDGCPLRDRWNPSTALRDRPVLGLEVLQGLVPELDGTWTRGTVYDPGSGNTYTCRLTMDGDDRLRLRGYVGIPLLGRTATWIRVGSEGRTCRRG
jgi:glucan biosynthesis protein C